MGRRLFDDVMRGGIDDPGVPGGLVHDPVLANALRHTMRLLEDTADASRIVSDLLPAASTSRKTPPCRPGDVSAPLGAPLPPVLPLRVLVVARGGDRRSSGRARQSPVQGGIGRVDRPHERTHDRWLPTSSAGRRGR